MLGGGAEVVGLQAHCVRADLSVAVGFLVLSDLPEQEESHEVGGECSFCLDLKALLLAAEQHCLCFVNELECAGVVLRSYSSPTSQTGKRSSCR